MASLTLEMTVGEIVAQSPGRARVFEQFGIDYCCGGKKPLAVAIREKNLDEGAVLGTLQRFDSGAARIEQDYSALTLTQLSDHIEQTHHGYLKAELPRLEFMVNKVAHRHGDHHPELVKLAQIFDGFKSDLEQHMHKEEKVLFPICRQLDRATAPQRLHCGSVQNPISAMVHEHDDAGNALKQMRELTDDYTPPADACNTYRALFEGLKELEYDMHRHVHKENSILFPKAVQLEARLGA